MRGAAARHVQPHHALAPALLEVDRFEEAEEIIREGMRRADAFQDLHGSSRYHAWLGRSRFLTGDWDSAAVEIETSLALANEVQRRGLVLAEQSTLAQIALHRGDIALAEGLVSRMRLQVAATGPQYDLSLMLLAAALLHEAKGQPQHALTTLQEARAWVISSGARLHYRWFGPDYVRLAVALDSADDARCVTAEVEQLATALGTASARGTALRCRGLLERDPDVLRAAVGALGDSPRRVECALACAEAGTATSHADAPQDALQLLEQAAKTFEQIGATNDLRRVAATMRELGFRRGQRGQRERSSHGWNSLTPSEQRVAALVAEGLSNPDVGERLFVSRRTVQTHVSHIFAKLGVSSRAELAAYVTRSQA